MQVVLKMNNGVQRRQSVIKGCVDKIVSNGFLHNNSFQEGRLLMIKGCRGGSDISIFMLKINNGVQRRLSVIRGCVGKISPNNIMVDKQCTCSQLGRGRTGVFTCTLMHQLF